MRPAVFLDRDNTLIQNDGDLGDPAAVRLVDGVPVGLKRLHDAGYSLVVVTNQAGVARGKFTEDDVDAVHQRIASLVDDMADDCGLIERFYYCPYHPDATIDEYRRDHSWRKPNPGMIVQAARDMELDLPHSWLIGDQERDIAAGRSAGCKTVLVTRDASMAQRVQPTEVAGTFQDAVAFILRRTPQASNGARRASSEIGSEQIQGLQNSTAVKPVQRPPTPATTAQSAITDVGGLRRAIVELAEEIRSDRLRRAEFTPLRMIAGVFQMLAVLLALLGLLQLDNLELFAKWMIGAGLAQLVTLTLLVLDLKG